LKKGAHVVRTKGGAAWHSSFGPGRLLYVKEFASGREFGPRAFGREKRGGHNYQFEDGKLRGENVTGHYRN